MNSRNPGVRFRLSANGRSLACLLVCVLVSALGGLVPSVALAAEATLPARSLFRLPVTLEQTDHSRVALSTLRGRPMVITMFYAQCTSVCPMLVHAMEQLDASIPATARDGVDYLLVSLDAEHDDAAVLAEFAAEHHLPTSRWHLAHVSASEVRLLAAALGIRYRRLPDGSLSHSSRLTLLDGEGVPLARTEVLTTVDEPFRDALLAALVTPAPAAAVAPVAAKQGNAPARKPVSLSFRLRQESVDDDAFARNAEAGTLRTRVAFDQGIADGWRGMLELDDVRAFQRDYQSTTSGPADRPVVADPTGTDLNVAAVEWAGRLGAVVAGRQRLNLDQQRFVGGSGWRQNEQTFDGVFGRWKAHPALEISAGYLTQVNRVFGPDNGTQQARWHGDVLLLQAQWSAGAVGTLTPFLQSMQFDNAAGVSQRTLGLDWKKQWSLTDGWKLSLASAWAGQTDAGANPTDYHATYSSLEAGLAKGPFSVRLGREVLGGHATLANRRFQTPLATLHAFQGWVDKFLTTPPQGVEDAYAALQWKTPRATGQLVWHDFRAAAVSRPYGTEWDASLLVPFGGRYELLLKGGKYQSRGWSTSATKLWAQLSARF